LIKEKVWIPLLRSLVTGVLVSLFGASFFVDAIHWRVFCLTLSGVTLLGG
jgi:hypothetical protein